MIEKVKSFGKKVWKQKWTILGGTVVGYGIYRIGRFTGFKDTISVLKDYTGIDFLRGDQISSSTSDGVLSELIVDDDAVNEISDLLKIDTNGDVNVCVLTQKK